MEDASEKRTKPRKRAFLERERQILDAAHDLFFDEGYYGLTMGKIANRIGCAKGTVYLHFPCKEDLIAALSMEASERRNRMFERAMRFEGRTRERMVAFAWAAEVFTRLNPADLIIFHSITGTLREKLSKERETAMRATDRKAMGLVLGVVSDAVAAGDLEPPAGATVGELMWGLWSLADGAYRSILSGVSLAEIDVRRPYPTLLRLIHMMADSYGWQPLSTEWDYRATLERARRETFPKETQRLCALGDTELPG